LLNAELDGIPVSLTYCTLCNAPILYDRRVGDLATGSHSFAGGAGTHTSDAGDSVLTFGNTGMLLSGNKVMYDEETETLWDQHVGTPIGGPYQESDPDLFLDQFPVTQTKWGQWRSEYPDTLLLDVDTGYGYDYSHYDGNIGFLHHYWNSEDVVQPGVESADDVLPEKASVYGLTSGSEAWVLPVDEPDDETVISGQAVGQEVVTLRDATGDVPFTWPRRHRSNGLTRP
jgi:hypothetical protein